MSEEKCGVHFGPDWCEGDFKDCDIRIESTETLACILHCHALTRPFCQGTGVIALGDEGQFC